MKVLRSLLWQGGAQVVGQAVSWVSTLVVVRLLTPADYGLVSLAMVFVGFFYMLADLGFGGSTVQARELKPRQLQELFGLVLAANAVWAMLTLLLAPAIAGFFAEPRLVPLIRILSINFVLVALYALPQALLMRELDFRLKARADMIATTISAVTSLVLAFAGYGAYALVGSMIALNLARVVLYHHARPIMLMPRFTTGETRPLLQFGMLLTLDRVLYYLYGQADVAIGGKVLGAETLGVYTVALTLGSMPVSKVLPVITQVAFAAFSRIQDDQERVNRNLLRAVQLVSLAAFPALFGLAAVAHDLIPLVLGEEWLGAIVPFQIICLILPVKAVASLFAPALFGVGRPGVNLANMAIQAVVMCVAFLVGVRYGIVGLAMAWVVGYPIAFGLTARRTLRVLGIRASDLIGALIVPAASSMGMLVGVSAIGRFSSEFTASVRLAAMIVVGAGVYGAATWLWNRRCLDELRLMLSS